ncbi:hypothetical protein [Streptomyces sp. NPDC093260]|uniref:hypothetical protein n=1 Tax=Streptomyces sp. NPDC093260 TaxID=3155073 RepID=UPI00343EA13F
MPRERRAQRRTLRSILRRRAAATRLVASVKRRPRSFATVAIAAGVDRDTAAGIASGLRSVAKRLGVAPAATARTRRTVNGGRARQTRTVHHWTLAQVSQLLAAYRPRKAAFVAAADRIAAFALAA